MLLNDCGATLCCALSDCGHVAPWCSDLMTRPHRYDSSPEKQLETTFSTCLSPSRTMRPSQVKSISSLKAHAAEVLMQLTEQRQPLFITRKGEAKAVLQDLTSFKETQEVLVLLKVIALGSQDVAAGRIKPAAAVIFRLRTKKLPD